MFLEKKKLRSIRLPNNIKTQTAQTKDSLKIIYKIYSSILEKTNHATKSTNTRGETLKIYISYLA